MNSLSDLKYNFIDSLSNIQEKLDYYYVRFKNKNYVFR